MKLYKKIFLTLLICFLFAQSSYAINEKKKAKATVKEAQIEYTNDVHSVFSLNDCVNIAVERNPKIRSSVYNEEVYKSQIGQAWSNFFPKLSVGVDISRTSDKYSG